MNDYMVVYRKFKRGRHSLKTVYTLASCIKEAKATAEDWLAKAEPLGALLFVRKVG